MNSLPGWVDDPALTHVWSRVRDRFERAGLAAEGTVRVDVGTRAERRAVGALLGRTITRSTVQLDLAGLDSRLRQRSGVGGLAAVLTELGGPLQDRPAQRADRDDARQRPLVLAAELVETPWSDVWVGGLARTGVLTGRPDAELVVRQAALVLGELTGSDGRRTAQSRVELAARLLGDAHALDRDRLVHQLVLRGLAAAESVPVPTAARDREALWARFGLEPDLLSRTCLVWRVRVTGATDPARRLDLAFETGTPVHLTAWDLRALGFVTVRPATRVLVCENPRVVEAMAEFDVDGWGAVCTSGEPNLVVHDVLRGLAASGAALFSHGDFDWSGVAIVNRIVAEYAAEPWQMATDDYRSGLRDAAPRLVGQPTEPSWDPELGAAMRAYGRAVHEEAVLTRLLATLA